MDLTTKFPVAASSQGGVGPAEASVGDALKGAPGTTGQVLTRQGDGSPAWADSGGGGGGPAILTESGTASKVSAFPVMPAYPLRPPGPVFFDVITNDGTTQTNYQMPLGNLIQPDFTGDGTGAGVSIQAGSHGTEATGAGIYFEGAYYTAASGFARGGAQTTYGGVANNTTLTTFGAFGGAQSSTGGPAISIDNQTIAGAGKMVASGGYVLPDGTNAKGGYSFLIGGSITNGDSSSIGGDVTVGPGAGATNGVFVVPNISLVDRHILNSKFQVSVAGVGYVGVYSKG